jgi:hypothetical protein
MTTYKNGAFVFTRARGLTPKTPEEIIPIANRHGIDPSVIPTYAGDRAAVGRAIARADTRIAGETYLLRPIRLSSTEVTYGIVRENKNGDDHLDHDHEATVSWKAEPDSSRIEGDHTIAARIRLSYAELRGKLVADDWTSCVTAELERLGAVAMRDDGRVHWLPQISLDEVRRLKGFLAEVGVTVVLAEVESENTGVVTEVVAESVEEQLHKLEIEVQDFDSKQKPSMFARRLEEYQKLRQRALLYQSALGIGAERTEQVLSELEIKVSAMLDIRTGMTVHKDGTVTRKNEPKPKSEARTETPAIDEPTEIPAVSSLTFAGATFIQADCYDVGEMLFTSSDEHAVSSVKALESMGLAGKWQRAGQGVEVSIQNSGPAGAETSIRLKLGGGELAQASKALEGLGIGVSV